jgi:hypothetical protein
MYKFRRKTRKVKACPFCGEKEKLQLMWFPGMSAYGIMCLSCLAEGPRVFYTKSATSKSGWLAKSWATRKWNNRAKISSRLYTVKRTSIDICDAIVDVKNKIKEQAMDVKVKRAKRVKRPKKVRRKRRKILHRGDERIHLRGNSYIKD